MNTKRMLLIVGTAGLFAGSLSAQVATVEGRLSGIDSDTLLVDYFPISDLKRENLNTDAVAIRQKGMYSIRIMPKLQKGGSLLKSGWKLRRKLS